MTNKLISAEYLLDMLEENEPMNWNDTEVEIREHRCWCDFRDMIEEAPAVDAVEVSTIRAWLYEIAGNNIGTEKEQQFSEFCEELISRLDGLRNFARERREENAVD